MSSKSGGFDDFYNARGLARRSRANVFLFCLLFEGPLVYNTYFVDEMWPGVKDGEGEVTEERLVDPKELYGKKS